MQGAGEIKKQVGIAAVRVLFGDVFEELPGFVGLVQVVMRNAEFGEYRGVAGFFLLVLTEQSECIGPTPVGELLLAISFQISGFLCKKHRGSKGENEEKENGAEPVHAFLGVKVVVLGR